MMTIKMKTTTFRALLCAVSPAAAASKDKTRADYACVRVRVLDGRIIMDATDGHRLHRAAAQWVAFEDGELPPTTVPVLIPQASLAAALKAVPAPKRGQAPAMAVLIATGLETAAASVRWAPIDGASFALREKAARGEREECAGGWGVHPAYLIDALEACRVVLDSVTGGVTVQTPEDGFSAVRVHAKGWLNDGEVEVVCVVMPTRL